MARQDFERANRPESKEPKELRDRKDLVARLAERTLEFEQKEFDSGSAGVSPLERAKFEADQSQIELTIAELELSSAKALGTRRVITNAELKIAEAKHHSAVETANFRADVVAFLAAGRDIRTREAKYRANLAQWNARLCKVQVHEAERLRERRMISEEEFHTKLLESGNADAEMHYRNAILDDLANGRARSELHDAQFAADIATNRAIDAQFRVWDNRKQIASKLMSEHEYRQLQLEAEKAETEAKYRRLVLQERQAGQEPSKLANAQFQLERARIDHVIAANRLDEWQQLAKKHIAGAKDVKICELKRLSAAERLRYCSEVVEAAALGIELSPLHDAERQFDLARAEYLVAEAAWDEFVTRRHRVFGGEEIERNLLDARDKLNYRIQEVIRLKKNSEPPK